MERSQRYAARIFAITYFISFAIIMMAFSHFYAPYLVWENGTETARHFIAHERAIRVYLAGAFLYGVGIVVLLTALYLILRPVNRGIALFAAVSKLTYAVFWFTSLLGVFATLHLLESPDLSHTFGLDAVAVLAGLQFDSSRDAYYVGLVFNGLGSGLFARVLFQSEYVPRILAIWGIAAALYEGLCGFLYLIHPRFGTILSANWYELPPLTFDILLCLWLLFQSFRSPQSLVAGQQS